MKTNYAICICLLLLMTWSSHVGAQDNTTVKTLNVPSDGSAVTASLKPRKIYRIIADGRVFDNVFDGLLSDAEFDFISTTPTPTCADDVTNVGIGINSVPIVFGGAGKTNNWGAFNSDNRYEVVYWIGKDDSSKVSFNYHDCIYSNNEDDSSDPLTIEIQAPQSGDCAADVIWKDDFPAQVNGVEIAVYGHIFDSTTRRAHMCAGSRFRVLFIIEEGTIVRAPDGVVCVPTVFFDEIVCSGLLDKTVKLTAVTPSHNGRGDEKLRTYTLIPVDPYK